jgi:hypothetical protein
MCSSKFVPVAWFAALVLVTIGCQDRRPLWSIEEEAIRVLDLEGGVEFASELPDQWPEPGCQMVLRARADEDVPGPGSVSTGSEAEDWRVWLGGVKEADVRCVGQCADGSKCLLHYDIELANNESAELRCACQPQDTPPCALTIEWGLGKRTQRTIRRVWCEAGDVSNQSCGLLFVGGGSRLEMTCIGS